MWFSRFSRFSLKTIWNSRFSSFFFQKQAFFKVFKVSYTPWIWHSTITTYSTTISWSSALGFQSLGLVHSGTCYMCYTYSHIFASITGKFSGRHASPHKAMAEKPELNHTVAKITILGTFSIFPFVQVPGSTFLLRLSLILHVAPVTQNFCTFRDIQNLLDLNLEPPPNNILL